MPGKLKLLFIIDSLSHTGGAQNQLALLIKHLDKTRFDVYVCNLSSEKDALLHTMKAPAVKLFVIPQHGLFDFMCFLELNEFMNNVNFDIITTYLFTADFYGRFAGMLQGEKVLISSIRNIDLWKKRRHVLVDRFLERYTFHFTANSRAVKEYLVSTHKVDRDKATVIYNGIDLERFKKREARREAFESFGLDRNKKIILTVARFDPQKDHFTLIDAAERVLAKRKDCVFLLVGRGVLKERVKHEVQRRGLRDSIAFIDDVENPETLYPLAYMSLLTSFHEGFPNFLLESMASELPVVATSVGGSPELVVDGETGFLVPPRQPGEITEKVLYLLDNPAKAERFGRSGRAMAQQFTIDRMVKEHTQLYLSLFDKARLTGKLLDTESIVRERRAKTIYLADACRWLLCVVLHYIGAVWIFERISHRNIKILLYHRVCDSPHDPFRMIIPPDIFDRQVRHIAARYKIISLSEALRIAKSGERILTNYAVVTFDDGYVDFFTTAFPIIKKYKIPASLFISVARIERQDRFWYDMLNDFVKEVDVGKPMRIELKKLNIVIDAEKGIDRRRLLRLLYEKCKEFDRETFAEFISYLASEFNVHIPLREDERPLTWDEVEAVRAGGVEVGSHGYNHVMLTTSKNLYEEIEKSKEIIEKRLKTRVPYFSYPYGAQGDFDLNAKEAVERAGYECALSNIDGINASHADIFELRRKSVSFDISASPISRYSAAMFSCEVSNMLRSLHHVWRFVKYVVWRFLKV